ncbi:hypothetical protein PV356_25060 [Streptomyces sp. WI03-5b]|uniref:hypothetical protein n=1 Tax=Streptomyces sp. WI03-5b TaxID=462946 RepID=UPI0029B11E18|nr:hypothetical protein [Streptomyces sp. WI03-5b]MDX2622758.1 hypothetical protein [Streptomyces sp. WI03-5b]
MHDKPLSKIAGHLLHRRAGASRPARERIGPDTLGLDEAKVLRFADGTLAPAEEARLAEEVAEILPLGWSLQPRAKERLHTVSEHLGGERAVLEWLDRHPGLPRLTARLVALEGNLDRFSEDPAVIEALRAARAERPLPRELEGVLPPATSEETLSDISYRIDELLFDRHVEEAARLALTTADWLRNAARQAPSPSPAVRELAEVMAHSHQDISEAGAPPGP